jgi:hypothetical protein
LRIVWDQPVNGASGVSYHINVQYYDSTTTIQTFQNVANHNGQTYDLVGLTPGTQYYIRVEAFNTCGNSLPTSDLILAAGTCPNPPTQVVTSSEINSRISCTWVGGNLNGFPLTGHQVSIQANDGSYKNIVQYCEENAGRTFSSSSALGIVNHNMVGNICTINEATLRAAPYNLGGQSPVTCMVVTETSKCASLATYGSGAIMSGTSTIPDTPNVQHISGACNQIIAQCNPGVYNGGSAIYAYKFYYTETSNFGTFGSTGVVREKQVNLVNNNAASR